MELTYDLEAGGLEELTDELVGGYKNGTLVTVIGTGTLGGKTSIGLLRAMNYEVRVIQAEELDALHKEALSQGQLDCLESTDLLIMDDYMCIEPFKYERKRQGKRKNANPYQSTMKRGR